MICFTNGYPRMDRIRNSSARQWLRELNKDLYIALVPSRHGKREFLQHPQSTNG
ncbi:MAG: hypothetical protein OJF52_000002 [Nitrospira sp.]|nr:MAG: hypothetical protein OJF52_000002 [Nitrospira sp.]